jgi:hypothetical protein
MAAFSVSKLIWSAMPLITSTTVPISLLHGQLRHCHPGFTHHHREALNGFPGVPGHFASTPGQHIGFWVNSAVRWTWLATSCVVAAI